MRRRSHVVSSIEQYARQHRSAFNGPGQALWAELRGCRLGVWFRARSGGADPHHAPLIAIVKPCAWTRPRDPAVDSRLLYQLSWRCPAPCSARSLRLLRASCLPQVSCSAAAGLRAPRGRPSWTTPERSRCARNCTDVACVMAPSTTQECYRIRQLHHERCVGDHGPRSPAQTGSHDHSPA